MDNIVYRGSLTKERLKLLAIEYLGDVFNKSHNIHDPEENHDAISIIRQPDGNYKGSMFKNGKLIEVREVKPEDCLLQLLVHA